MSQAPFYLETLAELSLSRKSSLYEGQCVQDGSCCWWMSVLEVVLGKLTVSTGSHMSSKLFHSNLG